MAKAVLRSELVAAITAAKEVVNEALPSSPIEIRAAALGVILREYLDIEIEDDRPLVQT